MGDTLKRNCPETNPQFFYEFLNFHLTSKRKIDILKGQNQYDHLVGHTFWMLVHATTSIFHEEELVPGSNEGRVDSMKKNHIF